jgi:hypothetical protein
MKATKSQENEGVSLTKGDTKKTTQRQSMAVQKLKMIEAMEKSLGIVTTACRSVGISRDTHYRYLREDDDYRRAIENIEGMALDLAESKLHQEILNGNTACIIFFLKTKGKKRGYVEKQEVETTIKTPDFSGLSTHELMDLLGND